MKEEIEDLKETVLKVALENPETRGNYPLLVISVWLDRGIIFTSKKGGYYLPFKHISEVISTESITRTYRKLCEEHEEIKPDQKVQEYRLQNEYEMNHINEWWEPVRDGSHPKQTMLME